MHFLFVCIISCEYSRIYWNIYKQEIRKIYFFLYGTLQKFVIVNREINKFIVIIMHSIYPVRYNRERIFDQFKMIFSTISF